MEIDVEAVANLSKLSIPAQEKEEWADQLQRMVDFAGQLQELDTQGIPSAAPSAPSHSVLREDEVRQGLTRQELLVNAPSCEDGFIVVPRVVE